MRAHRSRRHLPTRDELLSAPELAILASIEASIDLALVALVAAQPELWETPDLDDMVTTEQAYSAESVIAKAQALAAAIADYRVSLLERDRDELPF